MQNPVADVAHVGQAPPVRTQSVVTNMRCNQNCTYCTRRSATDDRAFIEAGAVRTRIDAALATGTREIVFSGGEPLLRTDFEDLVRHARARGATRVTVETNATVVDDARSRRLKDAGLDGARVNLAFFGDGVDAVTRDAGGFARTLAGIEALTRAFVDVDVLAVVVRSTRLLLPELPKHVAALGVRAIEIAVPTESPDPRELLSYEDAAQTILALERNARASGVALRMHPGDGAPPCVFAKASRARVAHLYTLTPGGAASRERYTHVAACDECTIRDRCAGFPDAYLARYGAQAVEPVRDDRTRRRLSILSSEGEQIARELVSKSLATDPSGTFVEEVIRVQFQCNQSCTFCFVSTHLPAAEDAAIEEAIRAAGARGSGIALSGGEPTLNPRLLDYVRLARASTNRGVTLQTNAIRLDDPLLVASLIEAGMQQAFVSLHGCTAAVSDAVTESPGTFVRTVAGIDNLARAPALRLVLNFVICEKNRLQIQETVRFVAARWPRAWINISFVAPSADVVPRDKALIPRYSDALPALAAAVAEAQRLGVTVTGFESMCGIPLCLVPASLGDLTHPEIPEGFDDGEFVHADACRGCRYESTCYGIRRGYAALYGMGELRTVPHPPAPQT